MGTAGVSLCNHQTAVVPPHVPATPRATISEATKGHALSPPVKILAPKKNPLFDGCNS